MAGKYPPSNKMLIMATLKKEVGRVVDLLCFCSVLCLLCLCARLFICAL